MARLKILTGVNNPVLRKISAAVTKFDSTLKKLAKEMKETLIKESGLGLAAPQVGKNVRMIIVRVDYKTDKSRIVTMVDPDILAFSEDTEIAEEGCLSIPGKFLEVERASEITVEFCDIDGVRQILNLTSLNARIVQHEVDHLNGVLFVDRIKKKKNEMAK